MKTKPPRERETKILKSIRVRLRHLGIHLFRRNTGAMREAGRFVRFASPGQSDLWGVFRGEDGRGIHVEIEVKRPGNKPTPKQLEWLKECTRLGAVAWWCDNVDQAVRIAQAVLAGGRIVWHENEDFDIEMP